MIRKFDIKTKSVSGHRTKCMNQLMVLMVLTLLFVSYWPSTGGMDSIWEPNRTGSFRLLISEVGPYGNDAVEEDWVELMVVEGSGDISDYVLTTYDSQNRDEAFSTSAVTVNEGDFILVHYNATVDDETDAAGDVNSNGYIDIYINSSDLSGTNEQVALFTALDYSDICDAVCWSKDDPSSSEVDDSQEIVNLGEWPSTSVEDMVPSADLEKGISIARRFNRNDDNTRDCWYMEPEPSPGAPNRLLDFNGTALIKSVHLSSNPKYVCFEVTQGSGNVSSLMISDLDGVSDFFSLQEITGDQGDMVNIIYSQGVSETDDIGDMNNNGMIDIYYDEKLPTSTMDSIVLVHGWNVLDALAWHSGTISSSEQKDLDRLISIGEWDGNATSHCINVSDLDDEQEIRRKSDIADTNSVSDWEIAAVSGGFEIQEFTLETFGVDSVTCGISPDTSFQQLSSIIDSAQTSICVEVYIFDNYDLAAKILAAQERGVEVKILLEGGPAHGVPDMEKYIMSLIHEKGGDVRYIINDPDKGINERYPNIHCKFVVVDHRYTFITSENFRLEGIPRFGSWGNRGWSVTVDSADCADYFEQVFLYDFSSNSPDIKPYEKTHHQYGEPSKEFDPSDNSYKSKEGDHPIVFNQQIVKGNISVTPVLCPDHTSELEAVVPLLQSAQEYIYVQQHSVSESWHDGKKYIDNLYLEELYAAARRGVKVRIQFDETFKFSSDHSDIINQTNEIAGDEDLDMAAIFTSNEALGIEKVHNKGIIVDGSKVLISSINWATNSIYQNREVGIIIENLEVGDYYRQVFEWDWNNADTDITGTITGIIEDTEGSPVEGAEVYIELDDGERLRSVTMANGSFLLEGVPIGVNRIHVNVSGYQSNQATVDVAMGEMVNQNFELIKNIKEGEGKGASFLAIGVVVLLLILFIIIFFAVVIAAKKNRKEDDEKKIVRLHGSKEPFDDQVETEKENRS